MLTGCVGFGRGLSLDGLFLFRLIGGAVFGTLLLLFAGGRFRAFLGFRLGLCLLGLCLLGLRLLWLWRGGCLDRFRLGDGFLDRFRGGRLGRRRVGFGSFSGRLRDGLRFGFGSRIRRGLGNGFRLLGFGSRCFRFRLLRFGGWHGRLFALGGALGLGHRRHQQRQTGSDGGGVVDHATHGTSFPRTG